MARGYLKALGSKELASAHCPLTSLRVFWHTGHTHVHTHTHLHTMSREVFVQLFRSFAPTPRVHSHFLF